jgi:hypothetical protein
MGSAAVCAEAQDYDSDTSCSHFNSFITNTQVTHRNAHDPDRQSQASAACNGYRTRRDARRRCVRSGPTIIPFPVCRGDVCGSLLGAMLFPSDPAKADTYAAQLLTKRPLQDYRRAGHGLSLTQEITFLDAPGREVSSQEIETQKLHGFRAGEVVKILWALICSRPDIASWDSAIWVVEDAWAGEGHKSGRSTFRADLSEMRPVLHLWGALALRHYQLLADPL